MGWQDGEVVDQGWQSGEAEGTDPRLEMQIESMSPEDLNVAKTKNNPLGDYLRKQLQEPVPGESKDAEFKRLYGSLPMPERPGKAEGMARSYLQGGTLGYGDEIVAGATAALDAGIRGDNFSDAYDVRRSQERSKLKQFKDDNPVLATGTEIVGALPTVLAPQFNFLRGGKIGNALKTGATQGGLYGGGVGEGSPTEQAISATQGALIGTGGGGLGIIAGKGIGAGVNRYMANKAAKKTGMSYPEFQAINRAMSADDSLLGAGQQRMQRAGPDAMLADSGMGASTLLDTAITNSPAASNLAQAAVGGRATAQNSVLTQYMDEALGQPQGLLGVGKGIGQQTKAARSTAYDASYATPINYADDAGKGIEDTLGRMSDRIKSEAFENANERMLADGVKNQQIMASVGKNGKVTFTEMPNVQQLDYLKRSLATMARSSTDDFGNMNPRGIMLSGLANDLKQSITKAVPEYKNALKYGQDKILREEALRLGSRLLRKSTTRETVADMAENMSEEAKTAAMKGLRSNIDEELANVKQAMTDTNVEAREAAQLIKNLSSRANREKVEMVIGKDASDDLFKQIDQSSVAFELKGQVAQNSKSALRLNAKAEADALLFGGPINKLREGEVIGAPKELAKAIFGRSPEAKQQISDEYYMNIVKALTGPRGSEARALLEKIQQVQPLISAGTAKASKIGPGVLSRSTAVIGPTTGGNSPQNDPYLLRTGR
tara:strand:+ start:1673 stop:3832 length:2160 start_codon:yes stop_codon:yes gene_type:complete